MCFIFTALKQKGPKLSRVVNYKLMFQAVAAKNNVAMDELLHLGEQKPSKLRQIWICD